MANGEAMPVKEEPSAKKARYTEADVKNMSSKQYIDELVVPTMLRALSAVNKERPDDPIEFLIAYLAKEKERSTSPVNPAPEASTPVPAAAAPNVNQAKEDQS